MPTNPKVWDTQTLQLNLGGAFKHFNRCLRLSTCSVHFSMLKVTRDKGLQVLCSTKYKLSVLTVYFLI